MKSAVSKRGPVCPFPQPRRPESLGFINQRMKMSTSCARNEGAHGRHAAAVSKPRIARLAPSPSQSVVKQGYEPTLIFLETLLLSLRRD